MIDKKKKDDWHGLFIPAGLFIGMGLGFLYNQFLPGLFIGLGAGFLGAAITHATKKKK